VLRHTYASHLAMNGIPLPVVAANLGHTDTRMIDKHYAHPEKSYIEDSIRANAPTSGAMSRSNVIPIEGRKQPVRNREKLSHPDCTSVRCSDGTRSRPLFPNPVSRARARESSHLGRGSLRGPGGGRLGRIGDLGGIRTGGLDCAGMPAGAALGAAVYPVVGGGA